MNKPIPILTKRSFGLHLCPMLILLMCLICIPALGYAAEKTTTTQLSEKYCGAKVDLEQMLYAEELSEATAYYFRVTNLDLGYQETWVTKEFSFSLSQFEHVPHQGVTYDVEVSAMVEKVLGAWGGVCQVTVEGEEPELPCLTDELIKSEMLKDPTYELQLNDFIETTRAHVEANNSSLRSAINSRSSSTTGCTQSYNIPVAVHIVYDPAANGAGALTYTDIQATIQKLNDDFNGSAAPNNACIEFCLAPVAPSGMSWSMSTPGSIGTATPGITRTANSSLTYVTNSNHPASAIGFPTDEYLNIWVVENITFAAGFAFVPPGGAGNRDGVVIRASHFNNIDATMTHEAGHFLGLLHPFGVSGSSCSPVLSNGNIATSAYPVSGGVEEAWDFISDTPPQSQGTSYSGGCTPILACPTFGNTMPQLFMDYSGQSCKNLFTQGQIDWMHSVLQTNGSRSNLVKMTNLLNTGVAGATGCVSASLTADFLMDTRQVCESGGTIDLQADANQSTYPTTWTWNFEVKDPNGFATNYASATPSFPSVTIGPFSTAGTWTVTLSVFDGTGGQISSSNTFFVTLCNPINSSHSQWFFGAHAGLDFSTGLPVPTSVNPLLYDRAYSVVTDPITNNILFYTSADDVVNRMHAIMPNGMDIAGTNTDIHNSGVVIVPNPDPSKSNEYYIFSVANADGLRWSVVDMNSGLGDVDPLRKNQPATAPPATNPPVAGFVSAIPHCNDRDYWIIVHSIATGSRDQMLTYLLTPSGLQSTPVTSNTMMINPDPGSGVLGNFMYMDVSRDGDRVAVAGLNEGLHLYDFDRSTGEFYNEVVLYARVYPFVSPASCSFSPSGDVLYTISWPGEVLQYDLSELTACNSSSNIIPNTFRFDATIPYSAQGNNLQLGPDDKIYIAHAGVPYLTVINYPERILSPSAPNAFGINPAGILLSSGTLSRHGLPNIVDATPPAPDVEFTYCVENCNEVNFSNFGCGDTYLWDFGHAGSTSTSRNPPTYTYPATAGTYTVTLTHYDAAGSVLGTDSQNITVAGSPAPTIVPNGSICSGPGPYTYRIDPDPNFSYPGATFNWTITGGQIVSNTNGSDAITTWNTSGGTLTLDMVDGNGCTHTTSLNQIPATAPTLVSVVPTHVSCLGQANGQAVVTLTGGIAPYTATATPILGSPIVAVGTTPTLVGLSAGTYTITVADANLCTTSATNVTITEPATGLNVTLLSQTDLSCYGGNSGSAIVTGVNGTLPYSYSWTSGGNSALETGLIAGIHTVTVTDANLCAASTNVTIAEPLPFIATITSQTGVLCYGGNTGSATVTAVGGTAPYTYGWSSSANTTATELGLIAGVHTATVTDANLCTTTVNVTITEPLSLTAIIPSQTGVLCYGGNSGSATIAAVGGTAPYTYGWSSSANTLATELGLVAGIYTATVTDANLCTATINVTITEPLVPLTATITSQTAVLCNGGNTGSATVVGAGGTAPYTYGWSSSAGTSATESGLAAGIHTATVTDANLCMTTVSVTITEPLALLTATIPSQIDLLCNGGSTGSATVTGAGGTAPYTYGWSSSAGTSATESGLVAGIHTATVTDANLCMTTVSVTITEPLVPLTATILSQTGALCNGGSTGSATVTGAGGTAPYTYVWSSGGLAVTETGLSAGSYTATVTDANLCTTTATVTITEPSISVDLGPDVVICAGQSVSLFGCVLGFPNQHTYTWSTGVTGTNCNLTVNPTTTTTYMVSVLDNFSGCIEMDEVTVNVISLANSTVQATGALLCEGYTADVSVITISSVLTTGAQYAVEDSNGNLITTSTSSHIEIPGLAPGVYTFEVYQELNGCQGPRTTVSVTVYGSSAQFLEHFYNPNGSVREMEVMAVADDDRDGSVYVTGWYDTDLKLLDTDQSGAVNGTYLGGSETIFIAKYDACGELQWLHGYGSNGTLGMTMPHDIVVGSNQNIYVTGQYHGEKVDFSGTASPGSVGYLSSNNIINTFVMQVDLNGSTQWAVSSRSEGTIGSSITIDDNQNVFIMGRVNYGFIEFSSVSSGTQLVEDYYTASFDANSGNCYWIQPIGLDGTVSNGGIHESIDVDDQGFVYVSGSYNGQINLGGLPSISTTGGLEDVFLARLDITGVPVGITNIGISSSNDVLGDMVVDEFGNAYLTGAFSNTTSLGGGLLNTTAGQDAFIAKYEPNGTFSWSKITSSASGSGGAIGTGIDIDVSGDAYIIGQFSGSTITFGGTTTLTNGAPTIYGFTAGYSTNGVFSFATSPDVINSSASCSPIAIATADNGSSYYVGQFTDAIDFHPAQSFGDLTAFFDDGFLAKVTYSGMLSQRVVSTEIEEVEETPSSFEVYPNPTTGKFTVVVDEVSQGSKILITNLLGHTVYETEMTYTLTSIDLSGHAEGVYLVIILNEGNREVKPFVHTH